jgi:DNA-binding response OmpR family regulator
MDTSPNVLIVEDHDNLRQILMHHLGQHGYRVSGVPDAQGVQDLLARSSFDAIVLDLNLPDEDGLSIASRLRETYPAIYIIMMTARNLPADRVAGYESGADVYITKPSSGEELLAAMNSWKRRTEKDSVSRIKIQFHLQSRVLIGQETVSLGSAETLILQALCLAPNARLAYFRLIELLDQEVDAKSKASLEVHITRLRKKLLQAGYTAPAIKAIRNEGYQLVEPISIV